MQWQGRRQGHNRGQGPTSSLIFSAQCGHGFPCLSLQPSATSPREIWLAAGDERHGFSLLGPLRWLQTVLWGQGGVVKGNRWVQHSAGRVDKKRKVWSLSLESRRKQELLLVVVKEMGLGVC